MRLKKHFKGCISFLCSYRKQYESCKIAFAVIKIILITISILICFVCISLQAQVRDSIPIQKLTEIEITGQNKPSGSLSTSPLQVISNEDLLQQGIQSVADAAQRFNGIVLKDYGGIGGLKTIAIRGMGAEQTAISYDGVMVSNVQSGQVDIGRFSLDNISMVSLNIGQSDEIFQAAKSFASSGTLNLKTITPEFKDRNFTGLAKITSGSFGLFNPMIDYAHKLNETFSLSANGSWQRADGNYPFTQENDKILTERKRKNSDVDIYRTEINIFSDFKDKGQLKTKLYYFDSERGLPGSVIIGNDYAAERLWDKNFFAQISYDKNLGRKFKLKSQAKYDYNYTRYEDTHDKYEGGKLTNKYKEQEIYLSNALQYSLNENFTFSFVEDIFYNTLNNEIQQFGDNLPYPKRYNSLSALAGQYKIKNLTITSSILATYISEKVKNNQGDKTYKKLSPYLGLSYKPFNNTNLRIRGFYKHIFRVPTFTELYYSSTNKDLKPESAKQLNIGATWVGNITDSPIEYINLSVDGYYNKVDDKIVIIPRMFVATTMNLGKVDIKGIDARLVGNVRITDKISTTLTASYSYMLAQDVTDKNSESYKNQIQYTPKHSGAVTISLNNPWVDFSYTMIAASNRYSNIINENSSKVDGYTDHSISLYREFKIKNNNLYIQGNLLNIWNSNYDVIAYFPMPGRSFKITAGMRF